MTDATKGTIGFFAIILAVTALIIFIIMGPAGISLILAMPKTHIIIGFGFGGFFGYLLGSK